MPRNNSPPVPDKTAQAIAVLWAGQGAGSCPMLCISCLCALALPDALRPVSRYSLPRSVCIVHNQAIATRRAADSLPHCPALRSCNPRMRTCKQDGRYGRGFYIVRFATIVRAGIGEGLGLIAFIDPTGKIGARACSFHWRHTREGGPDAAGHNPKAAVKLSRRDSRPQAPGIVLSYPPDTMTHCRLRVIRRSLESFNWGISPFDAASWKKSPSIEIAWRLPIHLCRWLMSRGALNPATDGRVIPASDWLDFYLLFPRSCSLARGGCADFVGFGIAGSRWARLAGIRSR